MSLHKFQIFLLNLQREAIADKEIGKVEILNDYLLTSMASHRTEQENISRIQKQAIQRSMWDNSCRVMLEKIEVWPTIIGPYAKISIKTGKILGYTKYDAIDTSYLQEPADYVIRHLDDL